MPNGTKNGARASSWVMSVIRQDGQVVAEHARCFGRDQTLYDPWHYVPVLTRKPGALRNGAPFKGWVLPGALGRVRQKLRSAEDGDRQMVKILAAVLTDSLEAVEVACAEALSAGLCSSDVVLNALSRQRPPRRYLRSSPFRLRWSCATCQSPTVPVTTTRGV